MAPTDVRSDGVDGRRKTTTRNFNACGFTIQTTTPVLVPMSVL
jgi:hypothetical protein